MDTVASTYEIWAQLRLSQNDADIIRDFFEKELGIKKKYLLSKLHITVYHGRRPLKGIFSKEENAHVVVPCLQTRFMVMVPGGENPRPEHHPAYRKVRK